MDKKDLFTFVKKFNKTAGISENTVIEGLKTLPQEDHELFMMLVNYKNGDEFKKRLRSGEI